MRIGILITARLGSTRLPRKHLLPAAGKSYIQHLVDRLNFERSANLTGSDSLICIATSAEPMNLEFGSVSGASVFYGDIRHIPLRHYQVALNHSLDAIVSVDGDDILCSPTAVRRVYEKLAAGESFVRTDGLALGLNAWGYHRDFLHAAITAHDLDECDTGWGAIFPEDQAVTLDLSSPTEHFDDLRFTLDYKPDNEFFRTVIESFGDEIGSASDEQIVSRVLEKEFWKINGSLNHEYYERFEATRVRVDE